MAKFFKVLMSVWCDDCKEDFDEVKVEIYYNGKHEEFNCPKCNKRWTGDNDDAIAEELMKHATRV